MTTGGSRQNKCWRSCNQLGDISIIWQSLVDDSTTIVFNTQFISLVYQSRWTKLLLYETEERVTLWYSGYHRSAVLYKIHQRVQSYENHSMSVSLYQRGGTIISRKLQLAKIGPPRQKNLLPCKEERIIRKQERRKNENNKQDATRLVLISSPTS
jgi:hypothetical protein